MVPPNAIDDGEKVTVHMGATTSGPFDLPEDCKLRSAVVWLGSGSDVVLKRSIAVVVPHSAVFTSPQHHSMMRFLTCEDCEGPRYKFSYSPNHFEVDEDQGWLELNKSVMAAIVANPKHAGDDAAQCNPEEEHESDDEFFEATEDVVRLNTLNGDASPVRNHNKVHYQQSSPKRKMSKIPPARYLAELLWPRGELLNSFKIDVYHLQNLPTQLYKVQCI